MRSLRAWLRRFGGIFRKHHRDAELSVELESHMQLHVDEAMRKGMSPEQARRDALIKLGGVEQTKENYRDQRSLPWLETTLQDLRFGARILRKNAGFTLIAVLTLALGVGANSAAFSIVNAVILRPLPYKDSQRLVSVKSKFGMLPDMELNLTWPAFEKIRTQVLSFEQSAVYWQKSMALTGRGDPDLLETASVSGQFFQIPGTRPLLGRLLGDSDMDERNGKVVVLKETSWRTRFRGNPEIVGQKINLDGEPYTIVGIAAKDFAFPQDVQAWTALAVTADTKADPVFGAFTFVGKLKSKASDEQLQSELGVVSAQMVKEFPKLKDGYQLAAMPLIKGEIGDARLGLYVLLGAATLVLLIACTNLASLLLTRGWARHQEMVVRAALGASRGRLLRQMLAESGLLGILGGAAGIVLAVGGVHLFCAITPADTPRLAEIQPDWTLVAFALGSALLTGVLFGLMPARHALRTAHETLREMGSRTVGVRVSHSKKGAALVVAEVALAFVLLIGAGLMLQTVNRLLQQSPGFRTDNLLTFDLYQSGFQSEANREKEDLVQVARTKDIVEQVRRLPGVEAVAAVNYGLLDGTIGVHAGLKAEGSNTVNPDAGFAVRARAVSATYFQTLGITLLKGRPFTDADDVHGASVAIVNEHMARKFWGTLDVLGKRFTGGPEENGKQPWAEIVGVVSDAREFLVRDEPVAEYYMPLYQGGPSGVSLLVRTTVKPEAVATTVTKQIWRSYPDLPVTHIATMRAVIEQSVGNEKLHAALLAVFGGIGLLMTLAGVYGVIAYAVERRIQEIGIRVALGASRKDVLILVCKHAFAPILIGIVIGVPIALLAQRAIASELYGVKATDPTTFSVVALLMVMVAAFACWVPARRALRVDPMVALRYE